MGREALISYPKIFLFNCKNVRNEILKELRVLFKGKGRFFMGGRKVMHHALNEKVPHLPKGNNAILVTKLKPQQIIEIFNGFKFEGFLKAGDQAPMTLELACGLTDRTFNNISSSLEPLLRKRGLPTRLNSGDI